VSVHGTPETTAPAGLSSIRARILVCHGALDTDAPSSVAIRDFLDELFR
jgi:hypothetical protein